MIMPTNEAAPRMASGFLVRSVAAIALATSSAACATTMEPIGQTPGELFAQCAELAPAKHRRSWGSFKMVEPTQSHIDETLAACDAWQAELTGTAPAQATQASRDLAVRLARLSKAERRAELNRACRSAATAGARGTVSGNWRRSSIKRRGVAVCERFAALADQ
jgi:hypothetical protein